MKIFPIIFFSIFPRGMRLFIVCCCSHICFSVSMGVLICQFQRAQRLWHAHSEKAAPRIYPLIPFIPAYPISTPLLFVQHRPT